jgi:hypothetical protein
VQLHVPKEHQNELIKTITEVVNGFITMIMYQKYARVTSLIEIVITVLIITPDKSEIEPLQLIPLYKTTVEISHETLCISPRTVEGHRNNLLLKNGV